MIRMLLLLFILAGDNFSVPLKPHLKGGVGVEGSTHLRGGIRPNPSRVHGSPRRAGSRVNRILILRANFRLTNSSFDTYSIGSSDDAYDQLTSQFKKYYSEQSNGFHQVEIEVPSLGLIGSQKLSKSHQETQSQGAVATMIRELLDLWDPHITPLTPQF